MPKGIPKGKTKLTEKERKDYEEEYSSRPENKARKRELAKERNARPENKAKRRDYSQKPEVKAYQKEYNRSEIGKARIKKYRESEKGEAKLKKWRASEKGKRIMRETVRKFDASEKGKKTRKAYRESEKGIAVRREFDASEFGHKGLRKKILLEYSKRHSNSDIPCCRCCGLNSHIAFLALDHIAGAKAMDSVKELTEIGYSSKMSTSSLFIWIVKNNFPDDFQILCHNCNHAKGHSKDNKCPLENISH